ncbi:MAG TPA: hypothetical protein VFW71_01990 [Actinomycetota bacterium]|nr:hypothetical protein [Actinomycetota bacterium]
MRPPLPPDDPLQAPGTSAATQVGVALGAALVTAVAAVVGKPELLLVVVVLVGIAASELGTDFAEQRLTASPLLYVTGALLFPVAAYFWHEPGISGAAAALILLAGARFVLAQPERGALLSIAAFAMAAFYVGFGPAFLLLIERQPHGGQLVAGLAAVALASHAARAAADRALDPRGKAGLAPHLIRSPTVAGVAAGAVVAIIGSVGLLHLAHIKVKALAVAQLGITLAAALTLGWFAWALIRAGKPAAERSPVPGQVLAAVAGLTLAAPALFYALRLVSR